MFTDQTFPNLVPFHALNLMNSSHKRCNSQYDAAIKDWSYFPKTKARLEISKTSATLSQFLHGDFGMTVSYPCCWLTMLQTISPKPQVLHVDILNVAPWHWIQRWRPWRRWHSMATWENCWETMETAGSCEFNDMSIWHLNDILGLSCISIDRLDPSYGGFLKWWYPTTIGFPTKNDHFGVFWGYHHSRKHPYRDSESLLLSRFSSRIPANLDRSKLQPSRQRYPKSL